MPNYIGSSAVNQLKGEGRGHTGPTGPTGPTGDTGPAGPRGNTGIYLRGISLIGNTLWNNFTNGTSVAASGIPRGKTGPAVYQIDYSNLGIGVSLISSSTVSGITTTLKMRPVRFVGQTVTKGNDIVTVNKGGSSSVGQTVTGSYTNKNITVFTSGITLAGISTAYENKFVVSNVLTPIIYYPHSDSSHYSDYISTTGNLTNGITLTININPVSPNNKGLLKAVVINLQNGSGPGLLNGIKFIPPTSTQYHKLLFIIVNAINKNTSGLLPLDGGINWSYGTQPCVHTSVSGLKYKCPLMGQIFFINGTIYSDIHYSDTYTYPFNSNSYSTFCSVGGVDCDTSTLVNGPGGGRDISELFLLSSSTNYGLTGACCQNNGTCTETIFENCTGFFHGSGTTCGNTAGFICNSKGPCCIDNGIAIGCFDDLTCSECLEFNLITGIRSRFGGTDLQCKDIDCGLQIFTGACCDGDGNCTVTTEQNCVGIGGYYHGNFSRCITDNLKNICSQTTGACCVDGVCTETTYENCYTSNGVFSGYNKTCANISCSPESICSKNSSRRLLPGMEYGGGIVVGKFIPGQTEILGCSELCSYMDYKFTNSKEFKPVLYTSESEPEAAVTQSCYDADGGYLIIVYPQDIGTDNNYNIKNQLTETVTKTQYHWGLRQYYSWGPLTNLGVYADIRYNDINYITELQKYGEGYWSEGVTGSGQAFNSYMIDGTFNDCSVTVPYGISGEAKLLSKSPYGLHGYWFRSYGLYNTIRAVSSLKAKALGFTGYMPATPNIFTVVQKLNSGITSASQGITGNSASLSDWFIPSHDEMAYIAAKTLSDSEFNVNTTLIQKGYQPIYGKYWTSTGTFDYTDSYGIYNGAVAPSPGTVAFSMEIPENGNIDLYSVYKTDRQEMNKIRPIRILRCDETYPNTEKIWRLPKL